MNESSSYEDTIAFLLHSWNDSLLSIKSTARERKWLKHFALTMRAQLCFNALQNCFHECSRISWAIDPQRPLEQ